MVVQGDKQMRKATKKAKKAAVAADRNKRSRTKAAKPTPKAATPEAEAQGRADYERAAAGEPSPAGSAASGPKAPRTGTTKAKVIEMISRKGGATIDEIAASTGWQRHTIRGFMSTLPKKGGPKVTSTRRDSDKSRVYELAR